MNLDATQMQFICNVGKLRCNLELLEAKGNSRTDWLLFQGWVGGVEELRIKLSCLSTKLKLNLKLSLAILILSF